MDYLFDITNDREMNVMADARNHSNLAFVSSFVSELDVAVQTLTHQQRRVSAIDKKDKKKYNKKERNQ